MKIERLTDDKIRITLNMDDLKENDIDFQTFISDPIESQDAFLTMLAKAEEQIGFNTDNCRIMVEALAMSNGTFILTVTRMNKEKIKNTYNNKSRKLNIRRKAAAINSRKAIYCFNTFDEFVNYCEFVDRNILRNIENFATSTSLYEYNNKYYLTIDSIEMSVILLKSFTACITEFAHFIENSDLFESKLLEYGKLIFKDEAITNCLTHFVK
jgi:adapter protein MecA 1/2